MIVAVTSYAGEPTDLITSELAAQILGVTKRQVQGMVKAGTLRPVGHVYSPHRRILVFHRGYIEEKARLLHQVREAEEAFKDDDTN